MHCFTSSGLKENGQTLVEAAFLLPIAFFMFGLLLQPAILLYCRCVIDGAAAETCRLAATATCGEESVRAFAMRRLAALPEIDIFHASDDEWEVTLGQTGGNGAASVDISGHVRLLPIVGISASTLTEPAGDGCGVMSVTAVSDISPAWLESGTADAEAWVNRSWD